MQENATAHITDDCVRTLAEVLGVMATAISFKSA